MSTSNTPSPLRPPGSPRKRLPVKPSAENLRKQAKRRAKAEGISLADAQHALARDYGCLHWPELMHVVETMLRGADQLANVTYEMEALPKAANSGDLERVRAILASGEFTQHDLDLALARSALRFDERGEIAWLLLQHGADPDGQYGSDYGPIVFVTGECLDVEGLRFLIDAGADVTFPPIDTKYGRQCPLSYWLGTYVRGRNEAKHRGIELLLRHGAYLPPEVTPPILAIHRGDAKTLGELIDQDRSLIRRIFPDMPYGNIMLAGATLLHCAVEFDEIECIDAILSRYRGRGDLDINARAEVIDGVGGQTPIFHLINTGWDSHFATLKHIIDRTGQWLDMSMHATWRTADGPRTKPVTPLEYAEEPGDEKWRKNKDAEIALLQSLDRRATIRKACERGDVAMVAKMLDEHPDLLTPELWPPSYQAKSVETTRLLLDRGLDPNVSSAPRRAIDLAAYHALPDIVDLLIARGADVTGRNKLGETPLDLLDAYEPKPLDDPDSQRVREALLKAGAKYDLHTAVRAGEVDEVRRLLDDDPSQIRGSEPTGPWPPLFTAARSGRLEVAKLLIERGADVHEKNAKDNTALWFACQSPARAEDRIAVARFLLDQGADPNRRCEDGSTPLHFAAWRGPAEMVKLLLDRGGRAWIEDNRGKKAKDYASDSNVNPQKDQIVAMLTEVQFDDEHFQQAVAAMDAGDVEGLKRILGEHPHLVTARLKGDSAITRGYFAQPTLLHFVANNPNRGEHMPPRILESAQVILDAGAEVDARTAHRPHELGGTTLALIASSGPAHTDGLVDPLLELLVSRGADPAEGIPAAMLHRFADTVRTLLRLGADHTPISAAGLGDAQALQHLLAAGVSSDELIRAGWAAAMNGQADAIDLLLDAGLDPNLRLPRPFDPVMLHEAAWFNHREVCERLLARGADPTIHDTQYNSTPAGWAEHNGHTELAGVLREAIARFEASKEDQS